MSKRKPTTKRATKVAPPSSRRRKSLTPPSYTVVGDGPDTNDIDTPVIPSSPIIPLPNLLELEIAVLANTQQLDLITARHKEIAEEETQLRERLNTLDREQQNLYLQRQCRTERLHYLKNVQRACINSYDHTGACVGNTASPF